MFCAGGLWLRGWSNSGHATAAAIDSSQEFGSRRGSSPALLHRGRGRTRRSRTAMQVSCRHAMPMLCSMYPSLPIVSLSMPIFSFAYNHVMPIPHPCLCHPAGSHSDGEDIDLVAEDDDEELAVQLSHRHQHQHRTTPLVCTWSPPPSPSPSPSSPPAVMAPCEHAPPY